MSYFSKRKVKIQLSKFYIGCFILQNLATAKPQKTFGFGKGIDNSNSSFVVELRVKHHAIKKKKRRGMVVVEEGRRSALGYWMKLMMGYCRKWLIGYCKKRLSDHCKSKNSKEDVYGLIYEEVERI